MNPFVSAQRGLTTKLKSSKQYKGKDRITLFDQAAVGMTSMIMSEASTVIGWLQSQPQIVSRAFHYHLLRYGDMADKSGIFDTRG